MMNFFVFVILVVATKQANAIVNETEYCQDRPKYCVQYGLQLNDTSIVSYLETYDDSHSRYAKAWSCVIAHTAYIQDIVSNTTTSDESICEFTKIISKAGKYDLGFNTCPTGTIQLHYTFRYFSNDTTCDYLQSLTLSTMDCIQNAMNVLFATTNQCLDNTANTNTNHIYWIIIIPISLVFISAYLLLCAKRRRAREENTAAINSTNTAATTDNPV